jgi:hypothetical protein
MFRFKRRNEQKAEKQSRFGSDRDRKIEEATNRIEDGPLTPTIKPPNTTKQKE